jgi:hypothetical protein
MSLLLGITIFFCATHLRAQTRRQPNILVIIGGDIGWCNTSIYNRGDMGYWTPNIDRIGKEGAMSTAGMDSKAVRPGGSIHYGAIADSHRVDQGWFAGSGCRAIG